MNIAQLQHGDLIFVADNTPMSWMIQNAEGDFEWSHVCSFWIIDGKPTILTTGARYDWKRLAFIYGRQDAFGYLAARKWTALRRSDLTPEMQEIRLETLLRLESRQTPYAVAKLIKLASWRFRAGVADTLHNPPEVYPTKVFCAEAEALGIIEAKRSICIHEGAKFELAQAYALRTVNSKYPQKLEACVHTPETLYDAPESSEIL